MAKRRRRARGGLPAPKLEMRRPARKGGAPRAAPLAHSEAEARGRAAHPEGKIHRVDPIRKLTQQFD